MIFDIENWLWKLNIGTFGQLAINPKLKTQNSIISFGYVDYYAKIFLILNPPLENFTTRIAILARQKVLAHFTVQLQTRYLF